MKVSIQCFGQLRTITKEQYVEIEIEKNSSILQALDSFKNKYGKEVEFLLYREGKVRDFYFIQLDKRNVKNEELEEIIVGPNQVISIIPFVAGG